MKLWNTKIECCGCEACANICPQNCIEMKYDEEGFLYPQVNNEQCISCGICKKICPIKNPGKRYSSEKAYIMRTRDVKLLEKSSSGGVFSGIAEYIFLKKGIVIGTVFTDDFDVVHTIAVSAEEIERMRGSKYVQSKIGNIFKNIEAMLKAGKEVCFVGTPCQVMGLKNFLKKEYKGLYTVDFVCHGVASPLIWNKYIQMLEGKFQSALKKYSFRSKHKGHHNFGTYAEFENGQIYLRDDSSTDKDFMHMAYFNEICSRPSCHSCEFKTLERASDITIFDCWHVAELAGIYDDDKGWSTVIPHTDKGEKILKYLFQNFAHKAIDLKMAIELDGGNAIYSMIPNKRREEFFKDVNLGMSCEELSKKYFKEKGKLKIKLRSIAVKIMKHLGIFSCIRRAYYSHHKSQYIKSSEK